MLKLPITFNERTWPVIAATLNKMIEADWWVNPILNPQCGQSEPAPTYEGLKAYADGVNWNPGGSGAGTYQYISAAWVKL